MAKKSLFAIDLDKDVLEEKPNQEAKKIEPQVNKSGFKYCDKCKAQVVSSAKFCGECGNKSFVDNLEELSTKYCVNCGAKLDASVKYCFDCGKNEFVRTYEEYEKLQKEKELTPYKEELAKNEEILKELNYKIQEKEREVDYLSDQYAFLLMEAPISKALPKEFIADTTEKKKLLTEVNQLEQKINIEKMKLRSINEDDDHEYEYRVNRLNYLTRLVNQAKDALEAIEKNITNLEGGI